MIDPRDIPGHRPDNDRAQLAALGEATRRNCWTCAHDELRRNAGGMTFHVCARSSNEDVVMWIEQHVAPDSPGVPPSMPQRDAPPCPVWGPKDEPATDKDALTVRPGGWRGHLPLCRGPGGTMARRMAALVRRTR